MKKISVSSLVLFSFAVFFIISCGSGSSLESVENVDDNGNLIEKYTRRKDTFAKEGLYTSYYENGKKASEANYVNDTLHGEKKIYTEDGVLEVIENYENGDYAGLYELYYSNGKVKQSGSYSANEMTGVWTGFYEDGSKKEEVTFEKNEENGPFKEYHQNGQLATEGIYKNGAEEGQLQLYDEQGELVEKKECRLGVCQKVWSKEEGDIPFDEAKFMELVKRMKAIEN